MQSEFLFATLFNLGINLLYTVLALGLGVAALVTIDKKLLKSVDVEEELKKGNLAIAIFAPWILKILMSFTIEIFNAIPGIS